MASGSDKEWRDKPGWTELVLLYGICGAIVGVGGLFPAIKESIDVALKAIDSSGDGWVICRALMSLMLLLLTVVLAFLWIWWTPKELRFLGECFGDRPVKVGEHLPIMLILAALLAALLNTYNMIQWYSLLFAGFKTSEMWALWLRDQKLLALVRWQEKRAASPSEKVLIVAGYYLDRPQVPLAGSFVVAAALVFGLLVPFQLMSDHIVQRECFAYGIMITVIIVNEAVYYHWRKTREQSIDMSASQVSADAVTEQG